MIVKLVKCSARAFRLAGMLLFGGVWYARKSGVVVGRECRIYTKRFGSEPFLIKIGNRVTVTSGVTFLTHDGSGWLVRDEDGRRFRYGRIKIGDNSFIGVNSIILPGVSVGNNVVVAAGSVLTMSVPDGVVVGGVPARILSQFSDFESRLLSGWISQKELDQCSGSYRERITNVVESEMRPMMEN